jgi:hypothetical protein
MVTKYVLSNKDKIKNVEVVTNFKNSNINCEILHNVCTTKQFHSYN